jgi:MFS family permease
VQDVRQDLTLLRSRRFLLLFCARTSSVLGSSIGPVALAFGVLALPHATATTLSIVLTANSGTLLLFLLLGGVIADRLPRHRIMYFSDAASGVSWAVIGVMLLTGQAPILMLAVMSAFAGLGTALFWPAMVGVVPQVTPTSQLQQGNAILRLGTNGARILGFAVAGAMVTLVGPGWAMLVNALGFLVSAYLLSRLQLPVSGAIEAANVWSDLRDGWREFWSRQWLWVVVLQFSILVAGMEAFEGVLGPYVAKERLGGAAAWSMILAGESIGMLAGVFVAMRIRPKRPILLGVLLTFPLAAAPFLLGIGAPVPVVAFGAFAGGMSIDIFAVLWDTTMQRSVPEEMLSRISSYDALGSLLCGPIGLIAAGPLLVSVGSSRALLISAAAVVVPTALALLAPGVRGMRMPAPDQGASQVAAPEVAAPEAMAAATQLDATAA